jgi:hypothetical protein
MDVFFIVNPRQVKHFERRAGLGWGIQKHRFKEAGPGIDNPCRSVEGKPPNGPDAIDI